MITYLYTLLNLSQTPIFIIYKILDFFVFITRIRIIKVN